MTLRLGRLPLRSIRRLLAMTEQISPAAMSKEVVSPLETGATVLDTDEAGGLGEAGPSTSGGGGGGGAMRAADKWVKVNGPPVGVTFGARRIEEGADLWSHNAWLVPHSLL